MKQGSAKIHSYDKFNSAVALQILLMGAAPMILKLSGGRVVQSRKLVTPGSCVTRQSIALSAASDFVGA